VTYHKENQVILDKACSMFAEVVDKLM